MSPCYYTIYIMMKLLNLQYYGYAGFGINEMAKTFDQLMVSLGYTTYVAQGTAPPPSLRLHISLAVESGRNWVLFRTHRGWAHHIWMFPTLDTLPSTAS